MDHFLAFPRALRVGDRFRDFPTWTGFWVEINYLAWRPRENVVYVEFSCTTHDPNDWCEFAQSGEVASSELFVNTVYEALRLDVGEEWPPDEWVESFLDEPVALAKRSIPSKRIENWNAHGNSSPA